MTGRPRVGSRGDTLRVAAPAKINLYLEVLGRRPDGYHELVTVLQTIDLEDTLELGLRERSARQAPGQPDVDLKLGFDDMLTRDGAATSEIPTDLRNLAVRAAHELLVLHGLEDSVGVDIVLTKRIPAGGGLGGGSSDAAASLLGLDELLGGLSSPEQLQALAAGLGSDVPFFLHGGTALCTGRGEQVWPLTEPPRPFEAFLLVPGLWVPTPPVYSALDAPPTAPTSRLSRSATRLVSRLRDASLDELERLYRNDLEAPACLVHPEIGRYLHTAGVHLSGSGSTMFAFGPGLPSLPTEPRYQSIRKVRSVPRKR